MKFRLVALLLICLAGLSAQAQMPSSAAEDPAALMEQGISFFKQGRYAEAEPLVRRSLAIYEKARGPDHPDVAAGLNNLAELYRAQGRYAQAEPLYRRALVILETALGPEHPHVATSLNNLALLYQTQGQLALAEPLCRRALDITAKALGPEHPDVARSLNNLAELYRTQGQFAQAEPLYRRSLAILEQTLGAEHPDVAASLNNLAALYKTQGHYAQAEPLYRRSLAIKEKALGPDHPDVALSLNNLAILYDTQGQYAQAEQLYLRSLAIRENALGPEHPDVARSLNNLAELYRTQGQFAQAETLYRRSLAISEKALGSEHPTVAASLNNLAALYQDQGQYAQAEPLYHRSLVIREKSLGPDHPDVALSLNNLAELYTTQGQYVQAEPLYRRSLAIWEKALGPEHPDVATSLNNLAALYQDQGQYAQVEPLHRRALAIREKALGPEHPAVALSLNNLAGFYRTRGQYAQAELLYRRSLTFCEKAFGPDHADVALSLNNLAALYQDQGQYAQAEPLYRRALAIREKALGPEHPDVALSLNNLAELYTTQGQYAQAEPLHRRALSIWEKAFGPEHPDVALSLNNLAELYRTQRRYAQAEPLYRQSLAIWEAARGPEHPYVAASLNNLAVLYDTQAQYAQAEPLYRRSLAIREKALGPEHPSVATSLNNLATLHDAQGQPTQALAVIRRASGIYRQRIVTAGMDRAAVLEAAANRAAFLEHLHLLARNPGGEPAGAVADEAFQVAQLEQTSGTAAAVAKMALRFARGDDALAGLVKGRQDLAERFARHEQQLVAAAGKPPKERNAAQEQQLREAIAALGGELQAADGELRRRFPEYQTLTRPEPATLAEIQGLLQPGEAMLVYALGDRDGRSFLWAIRPGRATFAALPVTRRDLATRVAAVRRAMEVSASGEAPPVDLGALHALYRDLVAPAGQLLAGARHVMVVPSGPLQSLPFAMLVATPPPAALDAPGAYRQADWLARRFALSVLPAVSSLRALRRFGKDAGAREPFAGFGDPVIGGPGETTRRRRAGIDLATVFRGPPAAPAGATAAMVGTAAMSPFAVRAPQPLAVEVADVEAIRKAPGLPETAEELDAMGKALNAGPGSIWLREQATETRIKRLDLSKYRTIAFATHGVMAGDVGGVGEPGLILTPPAQGSVEDDGYLAAGEVAQLKLDADWVVLSACNTAAADGTPGAEELSGLAKAFFYAGARSLLVSHWPVASRATVALTTAMLKEYEANPRLGKAEAHRKAMLALMETPKHPEYAHPIFWAPFVVVGEGGVSTPGKGNSAAGSRQ